MFNRCGRQGRADGFEDFIPKSATTQRGRDEARPRPVAKSGREEDPGRIGLHHNRDDACAIRSQAPHPADALPRTLEGKMNEFGRLIEKEIRACDAMLLR